MGTRRYASDPELDDMQVIRNALEKLAEIDDRWHSDLLADAVVALEKLVGKGSLRPHTPE